MIDIFEYLDYRKYLYDYYQEAKKSRPYFSFRYIAGKLDLTPGYVCKVMQSQAHLGVNNIQLFSQFLKLTGKKARYFEELVLFGRAKTRKEIELRFDRLQKCKGIQFRSVSDSAVLFYRDWYNMVILTLMDLYPFNGKNYRKLASLVTPSITVKQARDSISLLENLQLITKDEGGIYRMTNKFISTGDRWMSPLIGQYQKMNMQLAIQALENQNKEIRDISTVTTTFPLKKIPLLRERVKQFRQEILMMAEELGDHDTVMQMNFQFFPVAGTVDFGEKRG